jgi:hypothetical protein
VALVALEVVEMAVLLHQLMEHRAQQTQVVAVAGVLLTHHLLVLVVRE